MKAAMVKDSQADDAMNDAVAHAPAPPSRQKHTSQSGKAVAPSRVLSRTGEKGEAACQDQDYHEAAQEQQQQQSSKVLAAACRRGIPGPLPMHDNT